MATLPATLKTLYEQIEDWRLQSIGPIAFGDRTDDVETWLTSMFIDIWSVTGQLEYRHQMVIRFGSVSTIMERASANRSL